MVRDGPVRSGGNQDLKSLIKALEAGEDRKASLPAVVAWVSSEMRTDFSLLVVDDIPSKEALNLLVWAKGNETEFRRLYDCKRVPAKGFASDAVVGFIDTGAPIEDVMSRLVEGVRSFEDGDDHVRGVRDSKEEADRDGAHGEWNPDAGLSGDLPVSLSSG